MKTVMHYNFNVYVGRKMFHLNFSARGEKQALAYAKRLVPKFGKLRMGSLVLPAKRKEVAKGN